MDLPEMINAGDVVLKRWELVWAEPLTEAVRDSLPELTRFLAWAHDGYDVADSRTFLERSDAEWKDGTAYNYAVFTAVGELVGSGGLMTRVGPGALEIGYWIRSAYAGRGFATRAARSLGQVALSTPGIERVVIKHDAANPASGAVAAKAGFTQVGEEPAAVNTPDSAGVDLVWELRG